MGYFEGPILTSSVPKGRHEFLKYLLLSLRVPNWNCWITSLNSFTHSSLVSRDLAWGGRQFDFRQEIRCFLGNKFEWRLIWWQSWLFQHLQRTRTRTRTRPSPRVDNSYMLLQRSLTLIIRLSSDCGGFPVHTANLHESSATCSVTPNSGVCKKSHQFFLGLISQVFRLKNGSQLDRSAGWKYFRA